MGAFDPYVILKFYIQKHPTRYYAQYICSENFHKICKKTFAVELRFHKAADQNFAAMPNMCWVIFQNIIGTSS